MSLKNHVHKWVNDFARMVRRCSICGKEEKL